MKKIMLITLWFPLTILTLIFSFKTYKNISKTKDLQSLFALETKTLSTSKSPFLAYASIPKATQDLKTAIRSGDARPVMIDLYLERYDSPMQGYGQYIVETADKYAVDPYLFIAIMQQESNLGKKMPDSCHNGWGYGIHSRGTLCFDTWEEGIQTVMKGLKEKFLERGLQEPNEIMTLYTPLSNGSWAQGVKQFMEELQTGNF